MSEAQKAYEVGKRLGLLQAACWLKDCLQKRGDLQALVEELMKMSTEQQP